MLKSNYVNTNRKGFEIYLDYNNTVMMFLCSFCLLLKSAHGYLPTPFQPLSSFLSSEVIVQEIHTHNRAKTRKLF